MITLMDKNKKKDDMLIGDVLVRLPVGRGKVKMEIPSRSVSSLKPFVYFRYETTAQMFFEQEEYARVAAEQEQQAREHEGVHVAAQRLLPLPRQVAIPAQHTRTCTPPHALAATSVRRAPADVWRRDRLAECRSRKVVCAR